GIEKDKQGIYADKNRVSRVLPLETATPTKPEPKAAAPAKPEPKSTATSAPTDATKGNGPVPPWRKPASSVGDDIDERRRAPLLVAVNLTQPNQPNQTNRTNQTEASHECSRGWSWSNCVLIRTTRWRHWKRTGATAGVLPSSTWRPPPASRW